MFAFIEGTLVEKGKDRVIIQTSGGVGYELYTVESERDDFPKSGSQVKFFTHLYVREDRQIIYGFIHRASRDFFRQLLPQKGIGPSMAINILSGMGPEKFRRAIHNQDMDALTMINGVGKKTAQRLIVELAEKLPLASGEGTSAESLPVLEEAIEALIGLGFTKGEATSTVEKTARKVDFDSVEELIQATFSRLDKK
ncbi:MAG: Holliday junction branch migration protein RuvA [bacterium]